MDFNPVILKQALQNDISSLTDGISAYRGQVLEKTLLKKYVVPGANALLHQQAISSFKNRNEALSREFTVPNHRKELFQAWQYRIYDIVMSDVFQSCVLTLDSCLAKAQAGPGASRGTKHTNFLDKMFNSQLTYTRDILFFHYQSGLSERWHEAELLRDSAYSNKVVSGSALTSVPKDATKNRCICTEPSLNMFYQLGAKNVINELLVKTYSLNVSNQPDINKRLARLGSIDGSNATIDLRDASDNVHDDLCRQLFPPQFYRVLDLVRSQHFEVDGELHSFNMISSMGNGFTFSLMTLMFTTLLDVFLRTKHDSYTHQRDGVFGDDIILPSKYAHEFCSVLSDFGFIVNLDKSFIDGFFRESCGGDYFHGRNVRGIYIKEITNETSIYSAFNRLHYWSIRHGIPLDHTLRYLKGLVDFRPIPLHEAESSGFRIPREFTTNRKLDRNGATKYHCIELKSTFRNVGDNEYNFHGALIAYLGGYIVGQRIAIRNNGTMRTKVVKKITPHWDLLAKDNSDCDPLNPALTVRDVAISWSSLLEAA